MKGKIEERTVRLAADPFIRVAEGPGQRGQGRPFVSSARTLGGVQLQPANSLDYLLVVCLLPGLSGDGRREFAARLQLGVASQSAFGD